MTTPNVRRTDRQPARHNRGVNRCRRCKTAKWRCRTCTRFCCEHRCSAINDEDKTCLCGKCSLSGRYRRG